MTTKDIARKFIIIHVGRQLCAHQILLMNGDLNTRFSGIRLNNPNLGLCPKYGISLKGLNFIIYILEVVNICYFYVTVMQL